MAKRNTGRRSRARKRRSAQAGSPPPSPSATVDEASAQPAASEQMRERPPRAQQRPRPPAKRNRNRPASSERAPFFEPGAIGERPQAPWHPWPLSELVILAGAIGVVVAWRRGIAANAPLLVAGIVAVAIGTIEVSLREHLSGYRSHTTLLAVLPAIAFHTGVTLGVLAITTVPRWLFAVLLPLDAGIFAALFKLLRGRFQDARRERVFELRR